MSYTHLRREFKVVGRSARRVVILDCCWSGLALLSGIEGHGLVSAAAIDGTAVLTATAATKKALAPPEDQYPAFTGTLIDILSMGILGEPQVLDLGTLYLHADDRLAGRGSRGRSSPESATARECHWPGISLTASELVSGRTRTQPCG